MRCAISPISEIVPGARFRLFGKRGRYAISIVRKTGSSDGGIPIICKTRAVRDFATLEIVSDARCRLAAKRNHWPVTISLICVTWPVRDFANFRNSIRCAISHGQKTEPLAEKRFHLFGKRGRLEISLISGIVGDAEFHLAGKTEPIRGKRFQLLGNVGGVRFR